jgi:hypothetical protein
MVLFSWLTPPRVRCHRRDTFSKVLDLHLPAVVVINKVRRPDARIAEVVENAIAKTSPPCIWALPDQHLSLS